jgi:hypothetical protein
VNKCNVLKCLKRPYGVQYIEGISVHEQRQCSKMPKKATKEGICVHLKKNV